MIAIKESSGSLEKVMQMIREVKPGFQVLVGSAPTLVAFAADGRMRRDSGVRQRRAVFGDRHLGSLTAGAKKRRGSTGRIASAARRRW